MTYLFFMIVYLIIQVSLMIATVECVSKKDNEINLNTGFNHYLCLSILLLIINTILYHQFDFSLYYLFSSLLGWYLLLSSYIDLYTKIVYRIGSIVVISLMSLFLIIQLLDNNLVSPSVSLISLLLFIVIILILTKVGSFGLGDTFILIATTIYFTCLHTNLLHFEVYLYHLMFSLIVFMLINLKHINFKTLKLNEVKPFVPAISIAYILIIWFLF